MKSMRRIVCVLTLSILAATAQASESVKLESGQLALSVDSHGQIQILDKTTGTLWREGQPLVAPVGTASATRARASALPTITAVRKETDQILITAQWQVPLSIRWSIAGADEVACEISSTESEAKWGAGSSPDGPMLLYPPPFYSAPARYTVMPEDEGVLYGTDEVLPSIDGQRWGFKHVARKMSMPWWGVTDFERGLMTLLATPFHANQKLLVCETPDGPRALPTVHWIDDRGRFGAPRKLTLRIVREGGYVSMAKRYREELKELGLFKTFAEKARDLPAISQLKGAMDMWVFTLDGKALDQEGIRRIKDMGYDKLLLQVFHGHKGDPYRGLAKEAIQQARGYGWLIGYYHLYTWLMPSARGAFSPEQLRLGVKTPDGFYQTKVGPWPSHGIWCPAVMAESLALAARQDHQAGLNVFFTDTTIAGDALRDCHDPEHPLTVPESAAALREVVERVNRENMLVGSERGFWYAAKSCAFFEGTETIGQYFYQFNGPLPKQKHGGPMNTKVAGYEELFVNRNYGGAHRVPLFQLVFHDSILCLRRWDDHHTREERVWRANDLLAICYGVAPIVCFYNHSGPHILRDDYAPYHERLMRTRRDVCGWHEQIGFEEMTDHRFLTADRKVQQTTFANGKRVVVNFGDTEYRGNGVVVPPMSFQTDDRRAGK